MQTTKMSLANIQGKLSRTEMKNIMAGSGNDVYAKCCVGNSTTDCGPCSHKPTCTAGRTEVNC